jgi:pimeloyl-ACP methyl ester carboxylesterase
MREVMRDGISLLQGGRDAQGPLLLLLHGLGATKEVWSPALELLDASWPGAWIAPDFPGHGASTPCAHDSYGAYSSAVAALISVGRPVIILGHSLGGVVGLLLGSGLFGVEVSSVHALSVKVLWTADEIARIRDFSRTPPKYFDSAEEAVTRYLRVSGLHGLVAEDSACAKAGVVLDRGRYRLAAQPATNAVASGDGVAVRNICKSPAYFATGGADLIAPAEAFDVVGELVSILPGLAHNAHVQEPAAVCAWFFATCQVNEVHL